jgi:hypothetical protein
MKKIALRVAAATVASGVLAAGAVALAGAASASTLSPASSGTRYSFQTMDNAHDPTFNQLLGINDEGLIAGYFGSGAAGHPNKGYLLAPRAGAYLNENFPHSVRTQVTGLNNTGVTVGFWSSMNNAGMVNDNHGFVDVAGHFRTVDFPAGSPAAPPADQLLGVSDKDVAVGFCTDADGNDHGYEYSIATERRERPRSAGRLLHRRRRQHRRLPRHPAAVTRRTARPAALVRGRPVPCSGPGRGANGPGSTPTAAGRRTRPR